MNLLKALSGYTIISLLQALMAFLSISFFSHYMSIEKFGEYNLYLAIIPFLLNIMTLGVTGSVSVFYHKLSLIKYKLYLGQIIFYIWPLSLVFGSLLYLLFYNYITKLFLLNANILFSLVLLIFFQILPQVLLSYYQTTQQVKKYMVFNFIYLIINLLASISIYILYKDLYLVFLIQVLCSFIFSLWVIYTFYSLELLLFKYNRIAIKDVLLYGLPLIIHTVGITLLFMSDRFFISHFLGHNEVAYYSVSLQLSMVILILVNSFASAWGAFLFKELKETNSIVTKALVKKIYLFIIIFLLIPFLLYYIQVLVFNIFFPIEYTKSLKYILIISFGYSIMGIWKVFIGFLHFAKLTKNISIITSTALIINLMLNYYFIKYFSTIGVAYATLISMIVLCVMTLIYTNKYYKIKWSIR